MLTRRLVWAARKIGGDPILLEAVVSLVRDEIVSSVEMGSWVGKVLFDERSPLGQ